MIVSYSRVDCFEQCPYKYKLRYLDNVETIKADNADNPLNLGTALHTGLEKDIPTAVHDYFMQYPVIIDEHITEAMKLEVMIQKAKRMIPVGENEVEIRNDDFIGYIDLLAPAKSDTRLDGDYQTIPGLYDIYDFKYSNQTSHYRDSPQIHLYKYFFEKCNPGKKIRNLYYLCVPKTTSKQKEKESLQAYRRRLLRECERAEPELIKVDYDPQKVMDWMLGIKHMLEAAEYPKHGSWFCKFCEYYDLCQKGIDYMVLPKNERRNIEGVKKKTVWLYGAPFSGKTTFANAFPDPLMLNTDGNIKFVDAPYIHIGNKVEVVGRMTKTTLGWNIFKDTISELEKKENTFKTIVVDLLEDTYEMCRLYMYDQMGITHESDDSFRAWDKVRTEFLSTMRRLVNLDYENIILISHEDTTKDITKKSGDKVTAIKPNIQEKTANKVAGMVDIVARIVADGENRTLSFKSDEVVFGGGRLPVDIEEIPLDYDKFCEVYEEANEAASDKMRRAHRADSKKPEEVSTKTENASEKPQEATEEASDDGFMNIPETDQESLPFDDMPEPETKSEPEPAAPKVEEAPSADRPKVRTRRRRTE